MTAILAVARKELMIASRARSLVALGLAVAILLGLSAYSGYVTYRQQAETVGAIQAEKRAEWLGQGDKHPHIAAHYGTFVFKPKTVLSLFDPGIETYTGTSVYLEAHHQHEFMFRPAQDHGNTIRFGELSAALVLQVLLPLLIVFMAFGAFTRERERGTLRLLLSQGASVSTLSWGKALAYGAIVAAVVAPFVVLVAVLALGGSEEGGADDMLTRLALLLSAYGVYLGVVLGLTLIVSYVSKTGRQSLLTLLVLWALGTVLVPKAVAAISDSLYEVPSIRVFKEEVRQHVAEGFDGKSPRAVRVARLEEEYLDRYGVDSVQQLPLNFAGVSMQAGEEHADRVYDHHLGELRGLYDDQNRLSSYASLADPFLAIRNVSMALAGTDFHTVVAFEQQVEAHRRDLVKRMNDDMAQNSAFGEFYGYKAGPELWETVGPFRYVPPSPGEALVPYKWELASLAAWAILVTGLLAAAGTLIRRRHV